MIYEHNIDEEHEMLKVYEEHIYLFQNLNNILCGRV